MSLAAPTSDAAAICRTLTGSPDPFALYADLSDGGTRPGTMLFEPLEGPTLLLESAAVRAECRGANVTLTALSANGRNLLKLIAARLANRLIAQGQDHVVLSFPRSGSSDADQRLAAPSPFDVLRELTVGLSKEAADDAYAVMALGVIAYDHVDFFEDLPRAAEDPLDFPDYIFWVAESMILFEPNSPPRAVATAFGTGEAGGGLRQSYFDAVQRLTHLVERCGRAVADMPTASHPQEIAQFTVDLDDEAFCALVEAMKKHIASGDVYQIVASRSFAVPCPDPLKAYGTLRQMDRSPYGFYLASDRHTLFGASPETSVRIVSGNEATVEVKPIAGTRGRGATQDEDNKLEAELRLDAKEQAEHVMLVDLARNDVARVSALASRRVTRLMDVERYSKVMHLVSSVSGTLRQGLDFTHALKSCLNMGTLTGAPKIRATELLRQAERTKRGPYGGTIGWISGSGAMDSAIIIRTAVIKNGTAHVRAGAGIVHDSLPQAEAEETRRKASALLSVLDGASA